MKLFIAPLVLLLAACSADVADPTRVDAAPPRLMQGGGSHSRFTFAVSKGPRWVNRQTGQKVKIVQNGDTGAGGEPPPSLSAGSPQGDVLFASWTTRSSAGRREKPGVSSTIKRRPLPQGLAQRGPGSPPIDTGARVSELLRPGVLRRPARSDQALPTSWSRSTGTSRSSQNPATSSPGLAFLLSTVSAQPDWQQYWRDEGQRRQGGRRLGQRLLPAVLRRIR